MNLLEQQKQYTFNFIAFLFILLIILFDFYPSNLRPEPQFVGTVIVSGAAGRGSGVMTDIGIISSAHVLASQMQFTVKHRSGLLYTGTEFIKYGQPETARDWVLLGFDSEENGVGRGDIAKISCQRPRIGDRVIVSGYPAAGQTPVFVQTTGRVISTELGHVHERFSGAFIVDNTTAPGTSGGPVYNQNGEVIGIVTSIIRGPEYSYYGTVISPLPQSFCDMR